MMGPSAPEQVPTGARFGRAPAAPEQFKDSLFGSPGVSLHYGSPTQLLEQMFVANMSIQTTAKDQAQFELAQAARRAASATTVELASMVGGAASTPLAVPVGIPNYTEAHVAAAAGDAEEIREMIDDGEGVLEADHLGNAPLHYACSDGSSVSAVQVLVENGAPVNLQNFEGRTALHGAAATDDQATLVKYLLGCGANPNIADLDSASALHVAAANDAADVCLVLCSGGALVDAEDLEGDTPLAYAVRGDCLSAVRVLMAAGANPSHENEDGESPLELAQLSDPRVLEMLS